MIVVVSLTVLLVVFLIAASKHGLNGHIITAIVSLTHSLTNGLTSCLANSLTGSLIKGVTNDLMVALTNLFANRLTNRFTNGLAHGRSQVVASLRGSLGSFGGPF